MSLSDGSRVGSYEILSVIGEGGVGRVYRARDTKLQRVVAVKVLPESVAGDAERIARFEREARTLAALNHPHIAQIFAVQDGAIVMEMVEGEDLALRIARGPLSWRETLPIAKQIAEALEAAHEQGIIHRDLKPANIKVTADGVTFGGGSKSSPVWSPDGTGLYYSTNSDGVTRAVVKAVDGTGTEDNITNVALFPTTVSPDGGTLAGRTIRTASFDVVTVDLVKKAERTAIAVTNANESEAVSSPDGRYLAYQSDESGRPEIFVQAYPSGSKFQVTTTDGSEPRWTAGGRELIYRAGNTIMAVAVTLQPFSVGPPQTLFSAPNLFAFDATSDGGRFVIGVDAENREDVDFTLITGWFEELRARTRPQ